MTIRQIAEASGVSSRLLTEPTAEPRELFQGIQAALTPVLKRLSTEPYDVQPRAFQLKGKVISVEYAAGFPSFDFDEIGGSLEVGLAADEDAPFEDYKRSYMEALREALREAKAAVPKALHAFDAHIASVTYEPTRSWEVSLAAAKADASDRMSGGRSDADTTSSLFRIRITLK